MVVLTSFMEPDSPVHLELRNTRAILDKKDLGVGTLFITERALSWKESDVGFSLMYPNISLHAISNDPNVYPTQCIYVMVDAHVQVPGIQYDEPQVAADSDSESESEADISELILVPEELSRINSVYEVLKECQELNPDPEDMDDEEDIYVDADENINYGVDPAAGGDNDMENLANQLHNSVEIHYDNRNGDHLNDDIFEDAD